MFIMENDARIAVAHKDFKSFVDSLVASDSTKAYQTNPASSNPMRLTYTIEEVQEALRSGDPDRLRDISEGFYRSSGVYRGVINTHANLLNYDYILTPKFREGANKKIVTKRFYDALDFLDALSIPVAFNHITNIALRHGIYYGLLVENGSEVTFQQLPTTYCRTRYTNGAGINLVEFSMRFFDRITDDDARTMALDSFPSAIGSYYQKYRNNNKVYPEWMLLPATMAAAFYYNDQIPDFVSMLPSLIRYDESQDREAARDTEELQKLLINLMPMDEKNNVPIFTLEEAKTFHDGICCMLKNMKFVKVLTTFGEAKLEQVQDVTASATRDNMTKFKTVTYTEAGTSSELFNSTGNIALKFSVERMTAMMISISNIFAAWITYQMNERFANTTVSFHFQFLPTTVHNRKEMVQLYLQGAQYGYSKFLVGAAMNIPQSNLASLTILENDFLGLADSMIPVQSAHVGDNAGENTGGRPTLNDDEKSDKTIANEDAK